MEKKHLLSCITVSLLIVAIIATMGAEFAGRAHNGEAPLKVMSAGAPPAMVTKNDSGVPWLTEGALDLRYTTPFLLVDNPALMLDMSMVVTNPFEAPLHIKKLSTTVEWQPACESNPTQQEGAEKLMKTMIAVAQAHPAPVPISVTSLGLPPPALEADGKTTNMDALTAAVVAAEPALPVMLSVDVTNPFPVPLYLPKATVTVDWTQMCEHMPTKATLDAKLNAAFMNLMNTHLNPIPAQVTKVGVIDALLNADGTLNMAVVGPALAVANPQLPLAVTVAITNPFPFQLTVPVVNVEADLTSPCEFVPAAGDPMFNPAFGSKADCEQALQDDAATDAKGGVVRAATVKLENIVLAGSEVKEVSTVAMTALPTKWLFFLLQGLMSPAAGSGQGCMKIGMQSGMPPNDVGPASLDMNGMAVPARAAFECNNVCIKYADGKLGLDAAVDCTDLLLGAQVPWDMDLLVPLPSALGPFPPSLATPSGGDVAAGHLPYMGGPIASVGIAQMTGGATDGSKESCEQFYAGKDRVSVAKVVVPNATVFNPMQGATTGTLQQLAMTSMPRTDFFLFAQSVLTGKACLEVKIDATLEDGAYIVYLGANLPVQAQALCKICTNFDKLVLSLADAPVQCTDLLFSLEAQAKMVSMLDMNIYLPLPGWFGGAAGFPDATKVVPEHPLAGGILPYKGGPIASVGVAALTGGATDGSREACKAHLDQLGSNPTVASITLEDVTIEASTDTALDVTATTALDKLWFFYFGNSLLNDKVCLKINAVGEGVTAKWLGIWLPAAAEYTCELCITGGASNLVLQLENGPVSCTDMLPGSRITALYAVVVTLTLLLWIAFAGSIFLLRKALTDTEKK